MSLRSFLSIKPSLFWSMMVKACRGLVRYVHHISQKSKHSAVNQCEMKPTSLNSWIWVCSNMENTLEPAPSARFLAFFGACRVERKRNAVTTLIYSFAGGTFWGFEIADVQHERIFLLEFRNLWIRQFYLCFVSLSGFYVLFLFSSASPPPQFKFWM